MLRLAATASMLVLGAAVLTAATPRELRQRLERPGIAAVEGFWAIDGGSTLAVTATEGTDYDVTVVDSPDLSLTPGTVVGKLRASDAAAQKFVMTLDDNTYDVTLHSSDARVQPLMSLEPRRRLNVNLRAVYRFFVSISLTQPEYPRTVTARRVVPRSPIPAGAPLVL